jgi:hypothetical protein
MESMILHGSWIKSYWDTTLTHCLYGQNSSKKPHFGQKIIKSTHLGSAESPPYGVHMESIKNNDPTNNIAQKIFHEYHIIIIDSLKNYVQLWRAHVMHYFRKCTTTTEKGFKY